MPELDSPSRDTAFLPFLQAMAGALALAVAMGIGRFAFTPVLPMMLDDAGLDIRQGSLLASANYLGYLLGAVMAMLIRVPASTAIRIGLASVALGTLAMGLPLSFAGWAALRLVAGISSAWILISVSAWSLDVLARYRMPLLSGMTFAGVGCGIAVAGLTCLVLTARQASSAQAWLALGLLSAVATMLVWRTFRRSPAASQKQAAPTPKFRWNAESVRLVLCYGAYGYGYIVPATFLPVMARAALDDPSLFGWSWPLFGLAAALSTLAVTVFGRRISSRRLWAASHLIMAVGVLLPALSASLFSIFVSALAVGGTFIVITLVAIQEAKRVAGPHAQLLIAAMTSSFAAGQIAGPLSIAWGLGSESDFTAALLVAAALLIWSGIALAGKDRTASPA